MSFPPPSERQARLMWSALTGLATATSIVLVMALVWGVGQVLAILSPVLWPLAIAGVLAYLLDPVVDFLERRGIPRTRGILFVFALALVLVAGVVANVLPQIVVQTRQLVQAVPDYARRAERSVEGWISKPPAFVRRVLSYLPAPVASNALPSLVEDTNRLVSTNLVSTNLDLALTNPVVAPDGKGTNNAVNLVDLAKAMGIDLDPKLLTSATGWIPGVAQKVGTWLFGQVGKVASSLGLLVGFFLVPIYAFYFLLEKRGIESKWTDYLPLARSDLKDELAFVLRSINDYLIAFFRGQVLVSIIDGTLYAIGFTAIGLPYGFLLGAAAMGLTMIPYLGAAIVCLSALTIALVQYGDWTHLFLTLGVYGVVQLVEGLVIQPKIMGNRVGLHPLTIIVAMMVGTTLLGGILGAILAIPFTAALRVIMFRYVWKRQPAPAGAKG